MLDWYQETEPLLEAVYQIAQELPESAWNTDTYQAFCEGEDIESLSQHLEGAWAEYLQVPVLEHEVDRRTYVTHLLMKEARDSWRAALGGQLDEEESLEQAEWGSRLLATLATL